MNNKWHKKDFPRGKRVRWKTGRAVTHSRGNINRFLKDGTKIPAVKGKKFVSSFYDVGDPVEGDKVLIESDDGTVRLLAPGYVAGV